MNNTAGEKKTLPACYLAAKNVHAGKQNEEEAAGTVARETGMNESTALITISAAKHMLRGEGYKRTISSEAVEHFLSAIRDEFGSDRLRGAIKAVEMYIEYSKQSKPKIRKIISQFEKKLDFKFAEEIEFDGNTTPMIEGAKKEIKINAYERSLEAREKCIKYHGLKCKVCLFSFADKYGSLGAGFIHVHHLKPLSEIKQTYTVDPIKDLIPVCPNCHAMLHRKHPPYKVEELQSHIKDYAK